MAAQTEEPFTADTAEENSPLETQSKPNARDRSATNGIGGSRLPNSRYFKYIHLVAVVVFGVIAPAWLLYSANHSISSINTAISDTTRVTTLLNALPPQAKSPTIPAGYALYLSSFLELSNQTVFVAKQYVQAAILQVGLAVCSIGLLILLFGVTAEGIEFEAQNSPWFAQLNVRVASGGVAVFLLGALLVAMTGIFRIEYKTIGLEQFKISSSSSGARSMEIADFLVPVLAACSTEKQTSDEWNRCAKDYLAKALKSKLGE